MQYGVCTATPLFSSRLKNSPASSFSQQLSPPLSTDGASYPQLMPHFIHRLYTGLFTARMVIHSVTHNLCTKLSTSYPQVVYN